MKPGTRMGSRRARVTGSVLLVLTALWTGAVRATPSDQGSAQQRPVADSVTQSVAKPVAKPAAQSDACPAPTDLGRLDGPLPNLAARLRAGLPVTIVTIGSSSTAGAGASSIRATYPARLGVELMRLFPGRSFRVINSGVNGEEVEEMLRRFETQVFSYQPDLVIWQLGTNALLRKVDPVRFDEAVHNGLARVRRVGSDALLMNLQYSPAVTSRPAHVGMLERIDRLGTEERVLVYQRFAVMRDWAARMGDSYPSMISPDGLHQTDRSYGCVAADLARAIASAVARTPPPHQALTATSGKSSP